MIKLSYRMLLLVIFILLLLGLLLGPLFSETIVLEKGDVYVGDVISEDEKRITLLVKRVLIKKENIPVIAPQRGNSTGTDTSPKNEKGGRQLVLISLRDGTEVNGIPQYLANGDMVITANPYVRENIVLAKKEIKDIHFNTPQELKISSSKNLPGEFNERGDFIEAQFYELPKAELDKNDIRYRDASEASFADIQNLPGMASKTSLKNQGSPINQQITLSGNLLFPQHDLASFFAYGGQVNLGYQVSLWPIWNWHSSLLPAFGVDLGYLFAEQAKNRIKGLTVLAGPHWAFITLANAHWQGRVLVGFAAGVASLQLDSSSFNEPHISFAGSATVGYQFVFASWAVSLGARSSYIYDPVKPFISIDATLGLSYLF